MRVPRSENNLRLSIFDCKAFEDRRRVLRRVASLRLFAIKMFIQQLARFAALEFLVYKCGHVRIILQE